MRSIGVLFIISLIVCGCATNPTIPPVNDQADIPDLQLSNMTSQAGNHRLWGEWSLYFSEDHTRVEAVPMRTARFHLNTLKFLEEYCSDCLRILDIRNNGDETIDMTVRITHPFTGHPEYTGFDVKGIIMFEGSYVYPSVFSKEPPYPGPYRISWREYGDPEFLDPDGWTMRWSPEWDSGSDMPIFNYYQGRYSKGMPTANLNGYRNFYTDEERHMFRHDGSVTGVYRLWLPPGEPIVAGYAVEACWEPPIRTPVTNPLEDFPVSANQTEPYLFNYVVNNGETITEPCCGQELQDCSNYRVELARWDGVIPGCPPINPDGNTYIYLIREEPFGDYRGLGCVWECRPEEEDSYYVQGINFHVFGNGKHRWIARYCEPPTIERNRVALDVFDFVVDL
jgi:hypothetical protein